MRKYNFYPGPSTLPAEVLEAYGEELLEYQGSGASFIELSHRSDEVLGCHERIVAMVRELLGAGEDYHVLLLPGGAIGQYAAIPMNLVAEGGKASLAITGHWSAIASSEMAKFCELHTAVDTRPECRTIPDPSSWDVADGSEFVAFVDNETIHGVEFQRFPSFGGVPLVVDQSSNILSRPVDLSDVGVLFACLQKNLGPSGLAFVIVREDLCDRRGRAVPSVWDYPKQASNQSMANTPPTFQFRMAELMLHWVKDRGGVERMAAANEAKAKALYDYIDSSGYYSNKVDPKFRSRMNVPFFLPEPAQEAEFVSGAFDAGILGIKGHRAVGGMRASIYNAMPQEGVDALVSYMKDFAEKHG